MSVLSKPLPANHLLAIFGRVSLPTLVRLPLVCTAWSSLQPTVCQQTHTLSLCLVRENKVRESRITHSPFNRLSPSLTQNLSLSSLTVSPPNGSLSRTLIITLLTLFPIIRSLNMESPAFTNTALSPEESISGVTRLLRGWAPSLTRLGVYGFGITIGGHPFSTQLHSSSALCYLLSTINTLPHLRHLLIDVSNYFHPEKGFSGPSIHAYPKTIRFSLLQRLESFSFNSHDNYSLLLPSLQTYVQRNPILREIGLGASLSNELIGSLAQEGSPLLGRIRQYHYCDYITLPEPNFLSVHLQNLSTLTLLFLKSDDQLICKLFKSLVNCHSLSTLELFYRNLEAGQLGRAEQLPAIRSVTTLWLLKKVPGIGTSSRCPVSSHRVLAGRLPLRRLFPNLAVFQVEAYAAKCCTVCEFNYRKDSGNRFGYRFEEPALPLTDAQRLVQRRCDHLMVREAVKGCNKLRKIMVQSWKDSVRVYEELPIEMF